MVDGTIARKMGAVSQFGARLDTVADFVFLLVCGVKILPLMHIPLWLWVWVITVAVVKILNVAISFVRRKKLISIHSVLNKITGLALFLLPLTLTFAEPIYSVAGVCLLATVAAMQEGYLIAKGQEVL